VAEDHEPSQAAQETRQVPATPTGPQEIKVLLKHDDLVPCERRAANAMQLMDTLINEEPDMQNLLAENNLSPEQVKVTHRIVCLDARCALVEVVPDSETMTDVKLPDPDLFDAPPGNRSLLQFLHHARKKKGLSPDDDSWKKKLAITGAKSAVLSYVLGLGDRHSGNILVTVHGQYIHIDFGWQLGQTPINQKALGANNDMELEYKNIFDAVEADGQETMKSVFWPAVRASFKALRSHAHLLHPVITDMLRMYTAKKSGDSVRGIHISDLAARHVRERLLPGVLSDAQADRVIEQLILHNRDQRGMDNVNELQKIIQNSKLLNAVNNGVCRPTSLLSASVLDLSASVAGHVSASALDFSASTLGILRAALPAKQASA